MSILTDGSIAATIGAAFNDIFYACTITRRGAVSGVAHDPTYAADSTLNCKGMIDTWSTYERQNTSILATDVKILITATSLTGDPITGDKITIGGDVYTIPTGEQAITTDPATAVWVIQGRK